MTRNTGFVEWKDALTAVFTDKGAVLVLLVAPVLYSFFYPLPYQQEQVYHTPMVVVDADQSASSRQLIRLLDARPELHIQTVVHDFSQLTAQDRADSMGWAHIPDHFHRDLLAGRSTKVQVAGHGGYLLAGSQILSGATEAGLALGVSVKEHRLLASGEHAESAAARRNPVTLHTQPRYNTQEGYGTYVVPAVLVMIVHQTLLIGIALVMGWRHERTGHGHLTPSQYAGYLLLFTLIGWFNSLYAFGFAHWAQGFPFRGQWHELLLFSGLFSLATAALGLLVSRLFQQRELGMQVLLATAVPLFFISGHPIPAEALPPALAHLRWLVPSTAGIEGFLVLNHLGGGLADITLAIRSLLGLTLLTITASLWVSVRWRADRHWPGRNADSP